ncbi:MAG: STAS domain-containing protein [Peptococcaceae bacterium]|nr:STAS domain-containing protein [Peptococcaceae bacterium]MBO5139427.1 STAS domain-containing protein [Peptococcaceae bacterium]MBO5300634.1 STAS domain-containing protein [Peptococcaceae bacterium]MBP3624901.1 STAS domain-containing protein [Peptococcaceae bacterium]MBQ3120937.1 STAS domain-containing protein [Peptococcaceae bacterium]
MCQIQIEKKENYILATLQGEVTLGCTAEVKEKLKEYAELHKQYQILVDMKEVEFIDSSGLGVMVAWFKMCNQEQGKLIFCALNSHVSRIIGYAKLDKIFNIAESIEDGEHRLQ